MTDTTEPTNGTTPSDPPTSSPAWDMVLPRKASTPDRSVPQARPRPRSCATS